MAWNLRKMTAGTEQDITYLQLFLTNIPLYHPQTASRHKGKDKNHYRNTFFVEKKILYKYTLYLWALRAARFHHPSGDYSHRQRSICFRNNFHLCCNEHLSAFVHLQLQQSYVSNSSRALPLTGVMPGLFDYHVNFVVGVFVPSAPYFLWMLFVRGSILLKIH